MGLLSDEQQEQWNEESENRNKESGQERLDHFGLPCMLVEVAFLERNVNEI